MLFEEQTQSGCVKIVVFACFRLCENPCFGLFQAV